MAATTGMLISGYMSVGIRRTVITPISTISIARTTKVYGRRSARRTIHMSVSSSVRHRAAGGPTGTFALSRFPARPDLSSPPTALCVNRSDGRVRRPVPQAVLPHSLDELAPAQAQPPRSLRLGPGDHRHGHRHA